jgi:hypothetical protein
MSKEAGGEDTTTGDVPGGVTWADIYESPQVDRKLRRLPRPCREAVRLVWAAGPRELLVVLAVKAVNGIGLAGALIGIAGIALALLALEPWLVPLVLAAAVPLLVAVARGGELMTLGGRDADLFTLQAAAYLAPRSF